jgi:hypothetical protein
MNYRPYHKHTSDGGDPVDGSFEFSTIEELQALPPVKRMLDIDPKNFLQKAWTPPHDQIGVAEHILMLHCPDGRYYVIGFLSPDEEIWTSLDLPVWAARKENATLHDIIKGAAKASNIVEDTANATANTTEKKPAEKEWEEEEPPTVKFTPWVIKEFGEKIPLIATHVANFQQLCQVPWVQCFLEAQFTLKISPQGGDEDSHLIAARGDEYWRIGALPGIPETRKLLPELTFWHSHRPTPKLLPQTKSKAKVASE